MRFVQTPVEFLLKYEIRVSICEENTEKKSIFADIVEASALLKDKEEEDKDGCFSLSPNDKSFQLLLDIARIPKEKSKDVVTLLERAKDEEVIVEKFSNPQLFAFPHVYESIESFKMRQKINTENGKKGGRPKTKPIEETRETDSVPEDTPYSFRTKNGVETISEEQINGYQILFPSINVRESLERFKSWCEIKGKDLSNVDYFLKYTWFKNDVEKQKNPSFTTSSYRGATNNRPIEPNPDIITEEAGF